MSDAGDAEIYDEFDEWMGNADAAGVELQNQAAALDDAKKEERTYIDAEAIEGDSHKMGGQLIVRFTDGENTCFKSVSAHIVKKLDDGSYIALTARTNLRYTPQD